MVPHHEFTAHGYLDNPFHSWKLNPSGVLRSLPPLGMGWHVPNLGSYVRNQFQYTAHLNIGLAIGKTVLVTPEDFNRHSCTIVSHLHTKNRFEYTCVISKYALTLTARYFLVQEHALGCVLTLSTTMKQPLPVTCYLIHQHTHNPHTSRAWEHGLYAINGAAGRHVRCLVLPAKAMCLCMVRDPQMVGLVKFGDMGYVARLEDAAVWAHGSEVARPDVTRVRRKYWLADTYCYFALYGDSLPLSLRAL